MDLPDDLCAEHASFLESTLRPSVEISFELRPLSLGRASWAVCPYLADASGLSLGIPRGGR